MVKKRCFGDEKGKEWEVVNTAWDGGRIVREGKMVLG